MRELFQQELAEVQSRLVAMAKAVETAITRANTAFQTQDVALAERVIEEDAAIDAQAAQLDEICVDLIARQQPVARELRILISSLRISASLERMGDLARHIATLARYRFPYPVAPDAIAATFRRMGEIDVAQAGLVVQLLETEEVQYAEQMQILDDEIDALHSSVFDAVREEGWSEDAARSIDVALASRYFERFADHVVSISKKMQYLATGTR